MVIIFVYDTFLLFFYPDAASSSDYMAFRRRLVNADSKGFGRKWAWSKGTIQTFTWRDWGTA
jgi:hypothetical protein